LGSGAEPKDEAVGIGGELESRLHGPASRATGAPTSGGALDPGGSRAGVDEAQLGGLRQRFGERAGRLRPGVEKRAAIPNFIALEAGGEISRSKRHMGGLGC